MLKSKEYNEEIVSKIYDDYSNMILKIVFTYVKNTTISEDIMQEVFIKYINKMPKFESKENEKAWFIRVAINLSKDYLKSSWIRKRSEMPEELTYLQEYEQEIIGDVLNLPNKYKSIIYLYYYEGYSIKEIAKILKINEKTVGTRLSRGRKILKINIEGGI